MNPFLMIFSYRYANSYGYVMLNSFTVHKHKLTNHKLQMFPY